MKPETTYDDTPDVSSHVKNVVEYLKVHIRDAEGKRKRVQRNVPENYDEYIYNASRRKLCQDLQKTTRMLTHHPTARSQMLPTVWIPLATARHLSRNDLIRRSWGYECEHSFD